MNNKYNHINIYMRIFILVLYYICAYIIYNIYAYIYKTYSLKTGHACSMNKKDNRTVKVKT